MTTPRAMGRVTLILLAAALLLGASSVTGKPITGVHIIVGGWDVQVRPLK